MTKKLHTLALAAACCLTALAQTTELDSLCHLPMFQTSQLGICVYDLTDGREVYALGERQRMRPASCQKLVTAIAALHYMGGDSLFAFADTLALGWGWCHDDEWNEHDTLTIDTTTLAQAITPMMKRSDNRVAEAVFRTLAPDREAAAALVADILRQLDVPDEAYLVADGSGLSLYNYTTAQTLVRLLAFAWADDYMRGWLMPSLPIAGEDGTLARRMRRGAASGNVRAKTGSLTGVSSLAGYLTAPNGHRLAFAIINQGMPSGRLARDWQDKVCEVLSSSWD